jgi:hypothetical protein
MTIPRDEHITALFSAGHSQHAIAKSVGLSQPGVRKALIRLGLLGDNHKAPASNNPAFASCEASDNYDEPQRAPSQDNFPEAHHPTKREGSGPSDNHVSPAQVHEPEWQHQKASKDGDNLPQTVMPQGADSCEWCRGWFWPKRRGQRFCCNADGARAAGGTPAVEHSENCMLFKRSPGSGDNRAAPVANPC